MLLTRAIRMMCANAKAAEYLKKHAELVTSITEKKKELLDLQEKVMIMLFS